jgi:hypothetical protein
MQEDCCLVCFFLKTEDKNSQAEDALLYQEKRNVLAVPQETLLAGKIAAVLKATAASFTVAPRCSGLLFVKDQTQETLSSSS